MDHFAGLDVSVKETSVCIVDETGKIVREVKLASEPDALVAVLTSPSHHFKRIGLEAGPLSQWLYNALAEAGLPVICVETRHMRAVLKAQINKTDRNDARGMAQMMRVGLYRPVHVKTLRSQKLRMLLTHRADHLPWCTTPRLDMVGYRSQVGAAYEATGVHHFARWHSGCLASGRRRPAESDADRRLPRREIAGSDGRPVDRVSTGSERHRLY